MLVNMFLDPKSVTYQNYSVQHHRRFLSHWLESRMGIVWNTTSEDGQGWLDTYINQINEPAIRDLWKEAMKAAHKLHALKQISRSSLPFEPEKSDIDIWHRIANASEFDMLISTPDRKGEFSKEKFINEKLDLFELFDTNHSYNQMVALKNAGSISVGEDLSDIWDVWFKGQIEIAIKHGIEISIVDRFALREYNQAALRRFLCLLAEIAVPTDLNRQIAIFFEPEGYTSSGTPVNKGGPKVGDREVTVVKDLIASLPLEYTNKWNIRLLPVPKNEPWYSHGHDRHIRIGSRVTYTIGIGMLLFQDTKTTREYDIKFSPDTTSALRKEQFLSKTSPEKKIIL